VHSTLCKLTPSAVAHRVSDSLQARVKVRDSKGLQQSVAMIDSRCRTRVLRRRQPGALKYLVKTRILMKA